MMTLKEVPIGSTVTIKKVCATGPLKRRIVDYLISLFLYFEYSII